MSNIYSVPNLRRGLLMDIEELIGHAQNTEYHKENCCRVRLYRMTLSSLVAPAALLISAQPALT
jgi:hypothetical protein